MISREKPCEGIPWYDGDHPEDPYHGNRPFTDEFYNFTGWKCGRNGFIAKNVSDIRLYDFKTADNILAGVEISVTKDYNLGEPQVIGGLFVGKSEVNNDALILEASPNGVITARTENFAITGCHFYNYNFNKAAALGTCSHCYSVTKDDGARQVNVSKLYIDEATVTKKVIYTNPQKQILHDMDGTFTGLGPNTWATHDYKHLTVLPECTLDRDVYDGIVCDSSIRLRRLAFRHQEPFDPFWLQPLEILPYDDETIDPMSDEELEAYIDDTSNYGDIAYTKAGIPGKDTVAVFATGHKFKFHFGIGIDFEELDILPA